MNENTVITDTITASVAAKRLADHLAPVVVGGGREYS